MELNVVHDLQTRNASGIPALPENKPFPALLSTRPQRLDVPELNQLQKEIPQRVRLMSANIHPAR